VVQKEKLRKLAGAIDPEFTGALDPMKLARSLAHDFPGPFARVTRMRRCFVHRPVSFTPERGMNRGGADAKNFSRFRWRGAYSESGEEVSARASRRPTNAFRCLSFDIA
jgi:hypothetical protein